MLEVAVGEAVVSPRPAEAPATRCRYNLAETCVDSATVAGPPRPKV